jgi:hypothetical protein
MRLVIFCEAEADARTAKTLIDEIVLLRCDAWVRDLFEQEPTHVRQWVPDTTAGRDWYDVHSVYGTAESLGIKRVHGHFGGSRGQAGAVMVATIGRIARALNRDRNALIDALVIMWDMDNQRAERRGGLEQGAAHVGSDVLLVVGSPNPVRETWVLAGFEPEGDGEERALRDLHHELGFWPHEEPHQLTATHEQAKRSAKRVARALGLTELACLRIEGQARRRRLAARGAGCGLEEFLSAVETTVVPRIDPSRS